MNKLLLINNLPLNNDCINVIKISYKYNVLSKIYKRNYDDLNKHLLYYSWLNKKLNKKDNHKQSILKTIKEYDYYSNAQKPSSSSIIE